MLASAKPYDTKISELLLETDFPSCQISDNSVAESNRVTLHRIKEGHSHSLDNDAAGALVGRGSDMVIEGPI